MPFSEVAVTAGERVVQRASPAARIARVVPFLVLTGWIAAVALHASVVVNGSRLFYLDDVQMVGMRYGRNLAEGLGLVWNAGERVEGFSNPAWVLVMAGVHAAGTPEPTAALAVKAIAWVLACAVLVLSIRLRRQLAGSHVWADAALLLMLAMNADVVFWAANGFETPLLTALLLWLLTRVIDETESGAVRPDTMLAAGALVLVRSDAHLMVVAVVGVAVALSRRRAATSKLALLAGVIPALIVAARLSVLRRLGAQHVPLADDRSARPLDRGRPVREAVRQRAPVSDRPGGGRVRAPGRLARSRARRRVCADCDPRRRGRRRLPRAVPVHCSCGADDGHAGSGGGPGRRASR